MTQVAAFSPAPIPAGVGIDMTHGHYHTHPDLPATLQYQDIGDLTYSNDGKSVNLELVAGDWNHAGHLVEGTFADAVRLAREEAAIDVIDMPELSSAGVFRGPQENQWFVAPLMALEEGTNPADVDEPFMASVPVDKARGSQSGPGGVWDEIGYGRPRLDFSMLGIKKTGYELTATPQHDGFAAIVGIDRMITFDAEAGKSLLS